MGKKRKQYIWSPNAEIPRSTKYRFKGLQERENSELNLTVANANKFATLTATQINFRDSGQSTQCSTSNDRSTFCEDRNETEFSEKETSRKLYPESKITDDEATLLLLGYIMKNKLTREAASELLTLVNFFLPIQVAVPESIYSLKQKIPDSSSIHSTHFYCSFCEEYIGIMKDTAKCSTCDQVNTQKTLTLSGNYFTVYNVKQQMEFLLRNPALALKLGNTILNRNSSQSTSMRDIIDGDMYKKLEFQGFEISCCVNTDGVPVFKSSKVSIWPILLSLNELSYHDRSRNTLIAALWFGQKKPNIDTFFQPFIETCIALSSADSVCWKFKSEEVKSNVYFPLLVADSPARCMCQGGTQFNGSFGCTWCLTEGENFQINNSQRKWIYPPESTFVPRSHEQFRLHLAEFSGLLGQGKNLKSHFGIKSASKLFHVPRFNIVDGFVFDVMHACFLGVARAFANIWLDTKNHDGLKRKEINSRLSAIVVPGYFSRSVRLIDDMKFWKASEWRTWTYIAPIVLDGILPVPYLKHFSKFVLAIMTLSGDQVSSQDIKNGGKLFQEFVFGVMELYGKEFCSYNVHSLLHASRCVQNWGPLCNYSAFQFENFNGILLKMFKGANKIEAQISKRMNELISTVQWSYDMPPGHAVSYFSSLIRNSKMRNKCVKIDKVLFFGASKNIFTSIQELLALNKIGIKCKTLQCFSMCVVNSLKFTTIAEKSTLRCDSVAESNGDFFQIQKIFVLNSTPMCFVCKLTVAPIREMYPYGFKVIRKAKEINVLNLSNITSKFILYKAKTGLITTLVKLPSILELE